MSKPSFQLENNITGKVCGLDEVGRGPLAGPVVTACVYVPPETYNLDFVSAIRDSKKLSEKKLNMLFDLIREHFIFAIEEVCPREIETLNVLHASLTGMSRALSNLGTRVDHALVDGNHCPKDLPCPSTPVIKGDNISTSIAAASILAKVHRDRIMRKLAREYPHYGWDRNVGYPTQEHRDAIDAFGVTEHHRRNFAPVRNYIEFGTTARQSSLSI